VTCTGSTVSGNSGNKHNALDMKPPRSPWKPNARKKHIPVLPSDLQEYFGFK